MRPIACPGLFLGLMMLVALSAAAQVSPAKAESSDSRNLFIWGLEPQERGEISDFLKANEALLKRGDGCSLTVSWSDEKTKTSSAVHNVAELVVDPDEEEVTRLIHDAISGLDVRVGIRYEPATARDHGLRIALALKGDSDDVFSEISRSEALTLRSNSWKFVMAVKSTQVATLIYRFGLSCQNGREFWKFLRVSSRRPRK